MGNTGNKTVFISHATIDQRLHDSIYALLVNGFGIRKDCIFSSSIARCMKTKENFIDTIKTNIRNCDVIILLMTSSYMRSLFCLAELGAAWVLDKNIVPIVIDPVRVEEYNKTPLQGMQFRKLNKLRVVYDEFVDSGIVPFSDTEEFNKHYQSFLETIKFAEQEGNKFIATITQDRATMNCNSNLQGKRCLKLDSLIPVDAPPVNGETHWLFFDDNEENSEIPKLVMWSNFSYIIQNLIQIHGMTDWKTPEIFIPNPSLKYLTDRTHPTQDLLGLDVFSYS